MATEYGTRLRQARKHAGLNQVQLAKKTGLAQSTISSAERLGSGSTDNAVYAKACGVSAHWLETGEGEMLPTTATATIAAPSPTLQSYAQNYPLAHIQQAQTAIKGVVSLDQGLDALIAHLGQVSPAKRAAVASVMTALIHDPDDAGMRAALAAMLTPSGFVETQKTGTHDR